MPAAAGEGRTAIHAGEVLGAVALDMQLRAVHLDLQSSLVRQEKEAREEEREEASDRGRPRQRQGRPADTASETIRVMRGRRCAGTAPHIKKVLVGSFFNLGGLFFRSYGIR